MTFVELGPGTVLTGTVKRTLDGTRNLSVSAPGDLDTLLERLNADEGAAAREGIDVDEHSRRQAELWRSGLGRTSTQVLSEYFVTVTRKLAHPMGADEAWEDVQALMCWNPQPRSPTIRQPSTGNPS